MKTLIYRLMYHPNLFTRLILAFFAGGGAAVLGIILILYFVKP